ncbi:MAG: polysaccharide pyruvyl transferase family protein [Proteobacteria bacterium]|nr:polysaccharide pyruvyl transferase family protein [Pseudomonadota bacterium]
MKSLVLYGAYDRYNFGDMLMPIAYQAYIEKYAPEIKDRFKIVHASTSISDLSEYGCLKTERITDHISALEPGSAVVVVGGETLNAHKSGLMVMLAKTPELFHRMKQLKASAPGKFDEIVDKTMGDMWDYPFMIPRERLGSGVKLVHNSVGGIPGDEGQLKALAAAEYVSVRDYRFFQRKVAGWQRYTVAPCAVSLLAPRQRLKAKAKYFVFQVSKEIGDKNTQQFVRQIARIALTLQMKALLLPIGYAAGHDDVEPLRRIHEMLPDVTVLHRQQHNSSILGALASAQFYVGSSLHGAIISMATGIPHFTLSLPKADAYMDAWSPFPQMFSRIDLSNLLDILAILKPEHYEHMKTVATANRQLVKANLRDQMKVILS